MNTQELTALLVGVYTRLRRGDLSATAARREASGFLASLRELAAQDRREKAGDKSATKRRARERVELCLIGGDHAEDVELVRLTPDLRPWEELEAEARETRVTAEDVELLEVTARARARRGETTEQTANAESYVLKTIRYGLTLAPVSGAVTWREYREAVAEEDLRRGDRISLFPSAPDGNEPITEPVLTIHHGGDPKEPDGPPWPIFRGGTVTGYYVPQGWRRPEGDELAALLERLRTAPERVK